MKRALLFGILMAAFLGPVSSVFAQVEVTCSLNHKKYLLYEPIMAKITVKNISGQQLVLAERGSEAAILVFEVKNTRGYPADRRRTMIIEKPIVLAPREKTELLIYLNSAYRINEIDSYSARARVKYADYSYNSKPSFFDTYEGLVASKIKTLEPPREFTIRKISRAHKGTYLYMRTDDLKGAMNYGVTILDSMLPVFDPRMVMDGEGRIHTLHRKSPQQYVEVVIDMNGREVERSYYRATFGDVNLMRDEAGNVRVDGVSKLTP